MTQWQQKKVISESIVYINTYRWRVVKSAVLQCFLIDWSVIVTRNIVLHNLLLVPTIAADSLKFFLPAVRDAIFNSTMSFYNQSLSNELMANFEYNFNFYYFLNNSFHFRVPITMTRMKRETFWVFREIMTAAEYLSTSFLRFYFLKKRYRSFWVQKLVELSSWTQARATVFWNLNIPVAAAIETLQSLKRRKGLLDDPIFWKCIKIASKCRKQIT